MQNNAPATDISGNLTALNTSYLDAASQLSRRCGGGEPEERSRFTVQGRGGLPPAPDEALPAPAGQCQPASAARPAAIELPKPVPSAAAIAQFSGFDHR